MNKITTEQINKAQENWGNAIVAIGKAYSENSNYKDVAQKTVDELYAYNHGSNQVLFKPTLAKDTPFRKTKAGALSYLIAGNDSFSEDKGFALKPWVKVEFENDEIIINGGIKSIEEIKNHLMKVDGAMIGRAVYHSPYFLADIEKDIFNNKNVPTRSDVMEKLIPYIQEQTSKGIQLNHIMRHTVGLFHGQNGSRTWKQYLSKNMCIRDADLQKVNHIMDQVKKTNPVSLER